MTSSLAALETPPGTLRTWLACADLDTMTAPEINHARLATGATRSHLHYPAADVELIVGEIRPQLPSHMVVSGCLAALFRVSARSRISSLRFCCEWPDPPPEAEGTPESGEGLDAFTWRFGASALSVGTEDGEFLAARARRAAGVPLRLADELTFSTVAYTDSGLLVPVSELYPGEAIEIHFVVAWTDSHADESPSTWFAAEQDHAYIVASLGEKALAPGSI